MVNMVNIHQLPEESLHNVLDESPDEYFEGSTKTASNCPTFPPGFGGMIFMSVTTASPETVKPPMSAMLT